MKTRLIKLLAATWATATVLLCGCDAGGPEDGRTPSQNPLEQSNGGVITVERKTADRSRVFNIGGEKRTVSFSANVEYPSVFGIHKNEYRKLMELVDGMFNDGTVFETSVEVISKELFQAFDRLLSTNKTFKLDEDYVLDVKGRMTFADARYFSYKLNVTGNGANEDLRTYDRKKGRVVELSEFIPTNDFSIISRAVREYVKLGMGPLFNAQDQKSFDDGIEKLLFKKLYNFNVDLHGLRFYFRRDEWGMGFNMEVRVGWDSIRHALIDTAVLPTGKFRENIVHVIDETDPEWWKFPVEKYEYGVSEPPEFLWKGTNYPYASISHSMEIPGQGNISKPKYDLFQSALGAFITHGMKPHATIKDAVYRETVNFWVKHIDENKKRPEDAYGIYELNSQIRYRGPEYVSYSLSEQDGPPSGTYYADFVWSWRTMRQLKIDEVVDMAKRRRLWEMIRNEVSDNDGGFEWPVWAKDWPKDMSNFRLDTKGVYWGYYAGDVYAGSNGHMEIFLSWEQLKPLLRNDFILPTK